MSWCKIEVQVASPKHVSAPTGSAQDREVPQITVAALNLKTFINPQTNASEIVIATVMYLKDVRTDGPTNRQQWNTMERLRMDIGSWFGRDEPVEYTRSNRAGITMSAEDDKNDVVCGICYDLGCDDGDLDELSCRGD